MPITGFEFANVQIKDSFLHPIWLFEYAVILFGLFNIPEYLQKYINLILMEKQEVFVIIYLDDNLIYINVTNYIDTF